MMNPWLTLTIQVARLSWGAQGVIALRMMKLASGGCAAQSEASGMVSEKVAARSEAQVVAATAVLGGSNAARTTRKILNVYKKKVRANKRRLTTKKGRRSR
jgi:hypothetical protein